ncbi:MAG: WG repeat-containing protein [Muribaculaceae bacterium]|nr:WG repeat-containing protein [Muribaculaceae bacterium]
MKTVKVDVFGYEEFLEQRSAGEDGEVWLGDAYSRYAYYKMVFDVDGKKYTPKDFSAAEDILSPEQLKEFEDFDVEKFFEDSGADYGMLYINKAWTTIEIEIPEDEEFDPKKAAVVVREFLNLDLDHPLYDEIVDAFAYDGKVYDYGIEYSNGISGDVIWKSPHKWGYIDKSGKWVIEPKYKEAYPFSDGLAKVCSDGLYGFIDRSGAWVIEPKYVEAESFSEGMAKVKVDDKYGYIDKNGAMVIEPKYDEAESFNEGLALVKGNNGNWGFIDKTGVFAINPDFQAGYSFSDGLALVRKAHDEKSEIGGIDHSGAWVFIFTPGIQFIKSFSEGMALAKKNDQWGFINRKGELVVKIPYEIKRYFFRNSEDISDMGMFRNGIAKLHVQNPAGYGFIKKNGEWLIEPNLKEAGAFNDGLAYAESDYKKGFIDDTGEWVIETKFDVVGGFHEGVACVMIGDKAGFIDKTGNLVIEPQFEGNEGELEDMEFNGDYRFSEGLAAVTPKRAPIPENDDEEDWDYEDYDEE